VFKIPTVLQIRTEDMDLIAERGIAAHYSGRGVVSGRGEKN
jgi:GTP pyrophosphokinase